MVESNNDLPEIDYNKILESCLSKSILKINTSYDVATQIPEDVESLTKLIIATTNAIEAVRLSTNRDEFTEIKHEDLIEDLRRDIRNLEAYKNNDNINTE